MELQLPIDIVIAIVGVAGGFLTWFFRDLRIRSVERKAVTRCLLGDVYRLVDVMDRHLEWWCFRIYKKKTNQPLIPFSTEIFDLFKDRITIIRDEKLIQDLVQYYGYLKYANALQKERAFYERQFKTDRFDYTYLRTLLRLNEDFGPALFKPHFEEPGISAEDVSKLNQRSKKTIDFAKWLAGPLRPISAPK